MSYATRITLLFSVSLFIIIYDNYFDVSEFSQEYNVLTAQVHCLLTQLLTLFQICHECKCENTLTEVNAHGTMAEVTTICVNPECGKRTRWFSQPNFPGTKIAAGNLLLSFGILVAGTSATKVFRVLQHMGMKCVSLTTFFKYQRVSVLIK